MEREEKARCILKLCETVARNSLPDVDDVEDDSVQDMQRAYASLTSKLRYLMRQAEAAWTPAFGNVLASSSCMSVVKVNRDSKERKRGYSGKCMACGREETNCRYAVNLAGNLDPDAWLAGPESMLKAYNCFLDEYQCVFDKNFHTEAVKNGALPPIDKGCYMLGETCLRKAKIRFLLQSLLLETTYNAERTVEELAQSGELDPAVIYSTGDEEIKQFIDLVDKIELAIADPKRSVPRIKVDDSFWKVLDGIGLELADSDDTKADNMAFRRAEQLLQQERLSAGKEKCGGGGEDGHVGVDSDDEDEYGSRQKRRRGKKRKAIVHDSDEDYESCESEESEESGHADDIERPPPPPPPSRSEPAGSANLPKKRKEPTHAASLAGLSRAHTRLPSRKRALVELMRLQAKLAEEGRDDDSAVCTHAIFTIQELIALK